ncbi:MAG TPA: metal-sulfur cluster assembly factor [Ktedonobacterales bacterium]|nr:metal-sulfur cluster assembly factor [Ktedonobacterales bacterium]HEX5571122.1 metal-sulfur cluster assembly factor [Ktedonobacterales bacterium]
MDKPLAQSAPAEAASDMAPATISDETMERIYAALHMVDDPELGINIVDLGLIYGVQMREDGFVTITMTLTTPGCPMHASLADGVGAALSQVPGVTGGEIHLVWEPRWTPDMLTEEGRSALGYY